MTEGREVELLVGYHENEMEEVKAEAGYPNARSDGIDKFS